MACGLLDTVFHGGIAGVVRMVVEILLLAYLLYQLILVIRGTRAAPVILGVVLVGSLYYVSPTLGLTTIHWLIGKVTPYAVIALIVIFQTEIRRALRQMALRLAPTGRPSGGVQHGYEDVIFAVAHLSQERVGALMVLEKEAGLKTFIQSGIALDARLSSDLLVSIFQRSSPLHDGAVIIRRDRISAAACFLPLTTNPELINTLGTRHRAAIGITEDSDCLTIVVAETSGRISVAAAGSIETDVSLDRLRFRLIQHFVLPMPPPEDQELPPPEAAKATQAVGQLGGAGSSGASQA